MRKLNIFFGVSCTLLTLLFTLFRETPPPVKTPATLLKQASGENTFWDPLGRPHSLWKRLSTRSYDHKVKSWAVREIGDLGPKASGTVDRLIELFEQQDDHNTFDGILTYRSDVVRTLGLIGDPKAIGPIIEWFRCKASDPQTDADCKKHDLRWHSKASYYSGGQDYGPSGIIRELMWFDSEYYDTIESKLVALLADLDAKPESSRWARRAVSNGVKFFQSDQQYKNYQLLDLNLLYRRLRSSENGWDEDRFGETFSDLLMRYENQHE